MSFNDRLMLLLNGPAHPSAFMLHLSVFFAKDAILVIPLGMILVWLRSSLQTRELLTELFFIAVLGLIIDGVIGLFWFHPRPFANPQIMQFVHQLIPHSADSSFPSDHLTVTWGVAAGLWLRRATRKTGLILGLWGIVIAWARIYVGVHYPLDMVGSFVVGWISAGVILLTGPLYISFVTDKLLQLYRIICGPFIRIGLFRY